MAAMQARHAGAAGFVLYALSLSPAWSWGDAGHRITCEIAWQEFAPETRSAVLRILARDEPRYRRFFDSCVWAHREGMARIYANRRHEHYLNVPRASETISLESHCAQGCVVSAIVRYTGELLRPDTDPQTRLVALKFLDHLVGDVHQPLHVGFAEDRGGNGTLVRLRGFERLVGDGPVSLHDLWDTGLLEIGGMGRGRWRSAALRLHAALGREERAAGATFDPLVWAEESHRLVREQVYAGTELQATYVEASLAVVRRRLQEGGVRLARLLDAIMRGEAPFFVEDRRSGTVHHPACLALDAVPPGAMRVVSARPAAPPLHEGCPRSAGRASVPAAVPRPAPPTRR